MRINLRDNIKDGLAAKVTLKPQGLMSTLMVFICVACSDSDETSLPPHSENIVALSERGAEIRDRLNSPQSEPRGKLKLAAEVDQSQHPDLPVQNWPEISDEAVQKSSDEIERLKTEILQRYQFDDLEGAISLSQNMIEEFEILFGPSNELLLSPLGNLGQFYTENEQHKEAEETYLRSAEIVKARHGAGYEESYHYALTLEPVVDLYFVMSEYEKAKPLAERTLKTFEQFLGPQHFKNGSVLVNLGGIYHASNESEKAESYLLRAVQIYENLTDKDEAIHELHIEALSELSFFYEVTYYYKSQNGATDYEYIWDKSLAYQAQAKEIAIQYLGEDHRYTESLRNDVGINFRGR